jgi:hypothetical protein
MMPTFAPLPSSAPLLEDAESLEEDEEEALELEELEELEELDELESLELEPQAVRDIAATTPSTASDALVLRMCCLSVEEPVLHHTAGGSVIVVCANISAVTVVTRASVTISLCK